MKTIIKTLNTLILSAVLVGCSTSPSNEQIGTATGAVVGGVVGNALGDSTV